jgi:hypothetical protein
MLLQELTFYVCVATRVSALLQRSRASKVNAAMLLALVTHAAVVCVSMLPLDGSSVAVTQTLIL